MQYDTTTPYDSTATYNTAPSAAMVVLDTVYFPYNHGMNLGTTTTGLVPLTIGSIEEFQLDPWLNALPWNLAGGTVQLLLTDPNGTKYTVNASIVTGGYGATATWTVIGPATVDDNGVRLANPWRRAWSVVDALGRTQISRAIAFEVVNSPS